MIHKQKQGTSQAHWTHLLFSRNLRWFAGRQGLRYPAQSNTTVGISEDVHTLDESSRFPLEICRSLFLGRKGQLNAGIYFE